MRRPTGVLFATAGARELGVLRMLVFGAWFAHVVLWPIRNAALVPSELVVPLGLLRLVPLERLAASPALLGALQLAAVVGCGLCLLGTRGYHAIASTTAVVLLLHEGLVRALGGFLNHGRVAMLLLAVLLAAVPASDGLSVRRDREPVDDGRYAWPLLAGGGLVILTYTLVAARRLVHGSVEIFTGRSMELWMVARSTQPSALGFDVGLDVVAVPPLLAALPLLFLVTTLVELCSPLVLRHDRLRLPWLVAIVGFHVMVTITLNIDFRWHTVVVIGLFGLIPWLSGRRTEVDAVVAPVAVGRDRDLSDAASSRDRGAAPPRG